MKTEKTKIKGKGVPVNVIYVPLERITKHEEIPYRPVDKDRVKELTASIHRVGLETPLWTWGGGEEQQQVTVGGDKAVNAHYLVAGSHRRAALLALKKEDNARFLALFPNGIPVVHTLGSVEAALYRSLRENVQREQMTPAQIFPYLDKLVNEYQHSQKDIAKRVGKSEGWVSQMIAINEELPEDVKQDVLEGNIDVHEARKLAQEVRKAEKAGKPMPEAEIRKKASAAKEKVIKKKLVGKIRAEKRRSAKVLFDLYNRSNEVKKVSLGRKLQIAEKALAYLAGETENLPEEILNTEEAIKKEKEKEKEEAKLKKEKEKKAKKADKKNLKAPLTGKAKKKKVIKAAKPKPEPEDEEAEAEADAEADAKAESESESEGEETEGGEE